MYIIFPSDSRTDNKKHIWFQILFKNSNNGHELMHWSEFVRGRVLHASVGFSLLC